MADAQGIGWYGEPGPMTVLRAEQLDLVRALPTVPAVLCEVARDLLITPDLALAGGVPMERQEERSVRPVAEILDLALGLASALVGVRAIERRVVGTCRHFAVVSCALLMAHGIPARARCGFATYFVPGRSVDHWITELWSADEGCWVRIDSEIAGLDLGLVADPSDLGPEDFLTGGEAWLRHRAGQVDADTFGVHGTETWGWGEIAGNLVRDIASLRKREMLPWDEWGPMTACYAGELSAEDGRLLDDSAVASVADDAASIAALYESMPVPESLLPEP